DLVVLSDEAYEALVYDGGEHVSPASLGRGAAARTLTAGTFSKTYSMTGFRVGWLAGPAELVRAAARVHGHVTGNVCTFAQLGAVGALRVPEKALAARRAALEKRRDVAYALASRLFPCEKPKGGLFVFADARGRLGKGVPDSAALARRLLAKAKVAVVPGSACGREGWLRFSFSGTEKTIREGFRRIEEAL
ncbi:MAG: aminotransferase class I/II-fold pyridoxal phosphate-dependent enzyme, partial [Elusimicrobia bacterium]|nr:aminotransferase class I/II-fold pyridoxal phosphate-dependent enzyme [Elusimicrobiota bacterium]